MAKKKAAIPKPITITFQMPPELHRRLTEAAAEAGHTAQTEGIHRLAASFGIEVTVRRPGRPWPKKGAGE